MNSAHTARQTFFSFDHDLADYDAVAEAESCYDCDYVNCWVIVVCGRGAAESIFFASGFEIESDRD